MTSYTKHINATLEWACEENFPLLMSRWGYALSAFILFLIGFFGFFLNLMAILLMFKDRQLWNPFNIILFNLICSDFAVSILGNPITLFSALHHRWIFGHTMCVLYGFFMALLGITSITTLTVISFERYLMVTRPMSSWHQSSKSAGLSVLFIWSYSLALTTPPLMGWGKYVNEAANISCSVNWHEQSRNTMTYILYLFAMGQVVPLGVITYSYVNIVRTLKQNSKRLGRESRAESRASAMVFIMTVAFTVAWTPYSVIALMEQFGPEGIISPGVGVIPALVAKSSICYNPLIYVGMNSQFRRSIKRILGIHTKGKDSTRTEKFNITMMSPAHKMSRINNARMNSTDTPSSQLSKIKDKELLLTDEASVIIINEVQLTVTKNTELKTIHENRTSDTDGSGETTCNDDSSSQNKLELYGASYKVINERSAVLTFMDNKSLLFSKSGRKLEEENKCGAGNDAYEGHPTDEIEKDNFATNKEYQNLRNPKVIRQSFSLDLSRRTQDTGRKKRKLSV